MFYHDDGLPDENAFVAHLVNMKDGDTVKVPKGMRKRDAELCVGAAEFKTHMCFEFKKGVVSAYEDPYVTLLLRAEVPSVGYARKGHIEFFRQAIRRVQRKSKNSYRMVRDKIMVDV